MIPLDYFSAIKSLWRLVRDFSFRQNFNPYPRKYQYCEKKDIYTKVKENRGTRHNN